MILYYFPIGELVFIGSSFVSVYTSHRHELCGHRAHLCVPLRFVDGQSGSKLQARLRSCRFCVSICLCLPISLSLSRCVCVQLRAGREVWLGCGEKLQSCHCYWHATEALWNFTGTKSGSGWFGPRYRSRYRSRPWGNGRLVCCADR